MRHNFDYSGQGHRQQRHVTKIVLFGPFVNLLILSSYRTREVRLAFGGAISRALPLYAARFYPSAKLHREDTAACLVVPLSNTLLKIPWSGVAALAFASRAGESSAIRKFRQRQPQLAHHRQTAFPSATVLEMWFGLKSTTEIEINSVLPANWDKPARVTDC